jgi:hypothetical protein
MAPGGTRGAASAVIMCSGVTNRGTLYGSSDSADHGLAERPLHESKLGGQEQAGTAQRSDLQKIAARRHSRAPCEVPRVKGSAQDKGACEQRQVRNPNVSAKILARRDVCAPN